MLNHPDPFGLCGGVYFAADDRLTFLIRYAPRTLRKIDEIDLLNEMRLLTLGVETLDIAATRLWCAFQRLILAVRSDLGLT